MPIDKPRYTDHAQAPGAAGIKELDMMKVEIVELVNGAGVKFPIRDRAALLKVFPKSTPIACSYQGKKRPMSELIELLNDGDFPVKSAGDLATILTSRCFL